ncbi:Pyridine nucleotide-disulfide oxidoreductase domain-containing protein 2 [Chionoecetes opilio]|uniref:Pyridine nucleotide-disulfide oxidoreductase domain-containing protein 2 n=1 Tax=Chionoecetes opilio TaxID=41210 RepID=A0A8J4XNY0_CHIOP|nr:Pyridine nucleotide-disulfide oxidoreductase domain-containing protein 2 [Chionoecetes opilio]
MTVDVELFDVLAQRERGLHQPMSRGKTVSLVRSAWAPSHNGLVAAAYLAKAGRRVCLLERRHLLGGAAVTEEIVPGFRFSRASYVLGLLRPRVYRDLDLGFPTLAPWPEDLPAGSQLLHAPEGGPLGRGGRSLTLGPREDMNHQQVAQFSAKDADALPRLEALLNKFAEALAPLMDAPPPNLNKFMPQDSREK